MGKECKAKNNWCEENANGHVFTEWLSPRSGCQLLWIIIMKKVRSNMSIIMFLCQERHKGHTFSTAPSTMGLTIETEIMH